MDEIKNAFDSGASAYDALRRWIIPGFDNFYEAAIWAAEWPAGNPTILDIGAGTGLLSALLLQKYPLCTLTLLDISEKMLDVARERFSGRENVGYLVQDYCRHELSGQYDIICSALSIHHLEHEEKFALYEKIYGALKNGGIFVNAEQVEGESVWQQERYFRYWDEFVLKGPQMDQIKEAMKRRDTLDKMEKLSVQLEWLRICGFSDVDVVYKNRSFAVFMGRKISGTG
jgi:tRNA (cmo5U34)-methyltransferase